MAKVEAALMASTDEWINKKQYIYTTEYYLTIKGIKYWYTLQPGWTLKDYA